MKSQAATVSDAWTKRMLSVRPVSAFLRWETVGSTSAGRWLLNSEATPKKCGNAHNACGAEYKAEGKGSMQTLLVSLRSYGRSAFNETLQRTRLLCPRACCSIADLLICFLHTYDSGGTRLGRVLAFLIRIKPSPSSISVCALRKRITASDLGSPLLSLSMNTITEECGMSHAGKSSGDAEIF